MINKTFQEKSEIQRYAMLHSVVISISSFIRSDYRCIACLNDQGSWFTYRV